MTFEVQGEERIAESGRKSPRLDASSDTTEKRRTFTAAYKLSVLREAEACRGKVGAIGALLKREGLRSSHLVLWRKHRDAPGGLADRKRGPTPKPKTVSSRRIVELERQVADLVAKLRQVESLLGERK